MKAWYREDLAYIHDVGFGDFALGSAPGILRILARNGIREGLVVDLGCGSGLWAREPARRSSRANRYEVAAEPAQ
jgi:hypothetical protein